MAGIDRRWDMNHSCSTRMPPRPSHLSAVVSVPDHSVPPLPPSRLVNVVLDLVESPALRDGLRLIVLGGILEAARRGASLLFNEIYSRKSLSDHNTPITTHSRAVLHLGLTITAHIEQHDPAYDWVMAWLSEPERQISARNFEVDTRSTQKQATSGWKPETGLMLLPNFRKWVVS
jgi:hypothetical protein